MATTYQLITSTTLLATATSITLSSIPATFTDLALIVCARSQDSAYSNLMYSPNSTNANANAAVIYGRPSDCIGGTNGYGQPAYVNLGNANGTSQPANQFTNTEIYIPNYRQATSKSTRSTNMAEGYMSMVSGSWADSAVISSFKLWADGSLLSIGTSIYLYGILKA